MRPLVLSQLAKTLDRLNAKGFPALSAEFESLQRLPGCHSFLRDESWTIQPVIYQQDGSLATPQSSILAFYCLTTALRGVLLAVNFHLGTLACRMLGVNGPSVALSYTTAYHALTAYLALEGRVILDCTTAAFDESSPSCGPGRVVAVLTRKNRWILERINRSHRARWHQLCAIYSLDSERIPLCFHELFRFLNKGRFKSGVDLIEKLKDPDRYRLTLDDCAPEFFDSIAEVRHRALYQSLGDDPAAVDALVNQEIFSTEHLSGQSDAMADFAFDLLARTVEQLEEFIRPRPLAPEVRRKLFISVYYPHFDEPRIKDVPEKPLRERLELLYNWLAPTAES